jgi:hypothetical protein
MCWRRERTEAFATAAAAAMRGAAKLLKSVSKVATNGVGHDDTDCSAHTHTEKRDDVWVAASRQAAHLSPKKGRVEIASGIRGCACRFDGDVVSLAVFDQRSTEDVGLCVGVRKLRIVGSCKPQISETHDEAFITCPPLAIGFCGSNSRSSGSNSHSRRSSTALRALWTIRAQSAEAGRSMERLDRAPFCCSCEIERVRRDGPPP